jgi:hypothetical protein
MGEHNFIAGVDIAVARDWLYTGNMLEGFNSEQRQVM